MARRHHLRRRDALRERSPKVFVHREAPVYQLYLYHHAKRPVFTVTLPDGERSYTRVLYLSRTQLAEAAKHPMGLVKFARAEEEVVGWLYAPARPGQAHTGPDIPGAV